MTRKKKSDWNQSGGKWSRSFGERGTRIRLFQKRKGGMYYRAVWIPGVGRDHQSLGTHDKDEAERLGRALYAELLKPSATIVPGSLPLGELWRRYSTECRAFLDNQESTRSDDATRAHILMKVLGADRDVRTLTSDDQVAYAETRRAGGIDLPAEDGEKPAKTTVVRARSPEMDLVLLHAMLSWATTARRADGTPLLDRHPLKGVPRVREKNPRRPTATFERFTATRAAMILLAAEALKQSQENPNDNEAALAVVRWCKLELALVLAEATGRRLGAIRQLMWEDVDFEDSRIAWRADADKEGVEWIVPIPAELMFELQDFRRRLGTTSAYVFSAEKNSKEPMDRHLFDKWLTVAEQKAGLEKLKGGLWHPYRRKWATERKQFPTTDVAAAGGWKDIDTLLKCYQQPDEETLLAVMSQPAKLHRNGLRRVDA